jgi:hypothetical protein
MVSQPGLEGFLGETTPVKDADHLNDRLILLGDAFFDVHSPVMMFEDLNSLVQDKKRWDQLSMLDEYDER